ncbi:hypothetical protein Tco_1374788 [Tanacetum coccineum]
MSAFGATSSTTFGAASSSPFGGSSVYGQKPAFGGFDRLQHQVLLEAHLHNDNLLPKASRLARQLLELELLEYEHSFYIPSDIHLSWRVCLQVIFDFLDDVSGMSLRFLDEALPSASPLIIS